MTSILNFLFVFYFNASKTQYHPKINPVRLIMPSSVIKNTTEPARIKGKKYIIKDLANPDECISDIPFTAIKALHKNKKTEIST